MTGSLTKDAFADADFVIEAVFEGIAVKRQVFAEVEAVVRPDCVLATNTSSLSVTEMGAGLAHPSRVVGFHFFNPVAMMPLVEVVRTADTDDAALATALAVGKALKKNCVLVKDAPAFVVNRLLTRFLGEIIGCVDEGTPFEVAEHAPDPLVHDPGRRLALPPRRDHALPGPRRHHGEGNRYPVPRLEGNRGQRGRWSTTRRILPADRSMDSGARTLVVTVTPMVFLTRADSVSPASAAADSGVPGRRSTWTAS